MAFLGAGDDESLRDICATAALRRTHYELRLAVSGATRAEVADRLRVWLAGETTPGTAEGHLESSSSPRRVFVFSGQGPQWWAMGRELLATEPAFREMLQRCETLVAAEAGWSLLAELGRPEAESRLDQTEIAQPAIFALQVGLAALWKAWGVTPDAVVGHSVGEIAAAHVAGILSLEDAVRVVVQRGRLMQQATGHGKMASVELPVAEVEPYLAGQRERVAVAAVNGPATTVVSGEPDAVEAVLESIRGAGAPVRMLPVNYAFHSPQMEPYRLELVCSIAGLSPGAGTIPFFSTVTGAVAAGRTLDAEYWGPQSAPAGALRCRN